MIDKFIENFKLDGQIDDKMFSHCGSDEDILSSLSGLSFEEGLYRVYSTSEVNKWTGLVSSIFRQYENRISCFASDWLGRQFATDRARTVNNRSQILLFQVGVGDVFEIPANVQEFHNSVLVDMPNPTLEKDLYKSWLASGNSAPHRQQCVGYKLPPFLGGDDRIDNLQIIDMEVEWVITGQLLEASAIVPKGSSIDHVTLDVESIKSI